MACLASAAAEDIHDPDAVPYLHPDHVRPELRDGPRELVAHDARQVPGHRLGAAGLVVARPGETRNVGTADAGCIDPQDDFPGAGTGSGTRRRSSPGPALVLTSARIEREEPPPGQPMPTIGG